MDGFYIGRYEVGDDNATSRNENSGTNHTAVEMQGKYVYNYINWYEAYDICKRFSQTNESINSCLIYGCLWDATLEYLVESGNKTYYEIAVDSSGWGNYYYATFSYNNMSGKTKIKIQGNAVLIPTGSTEYTNVCNVYDLAGNVWEWTQEKGHYNNRYYRGSTFSDPVLMLTVSARNNWVELSYCNLYIGFRAMLYIK